MATEENNRETESEDPTTLTDEEFAEYQKKERRKGCIIAAFIDIITGFFH